MTCAAVMDISSAPYGTMIDKVMEVISVFPQFAEQAQLPQTAAENV
ncbi:MAG: hypothetical protein II735_05040 [Clostridia bacterium]|nr:hypothetical protein [Clostridia bacterium]